MKTLKSLVIVCILAMITSCASAIKFPISKDAPAADITALIKQDKYNNYKIEVVALNLANANRLNPPKNNYSVWIVAENGEIKNIGQLTQKNAKKAVLETSTPFNIEEIFITAEDQANLNTPSGKEISRIKVN